MKLISVVIPTYNEEKNIPLLYGELQKVFQTLKLEYVFEIIFVNDGSRDNSWREIGKLAQADKDVRGLSFSRNFGHQQALEAGLKSAKGDAVIMMDCDLQHPPGLILEMIKHWKSGYKTYRKRFDHRGYIAHGLICSERCAEIGCGGN